MERTMRMAKSVSGARIKRLREERDLSQGQLATYAGITQSYVSYIEKEGSPNVGSDALVSIARILETSVDYIVGLTDDPRSPTRKPVGELTPEEEELLHNYRLVESDEARRLIQTVVRSAVEYGV